MEYPPNEDKAWEIRVYDLKGNGIYYERSLRREEAEKIAKEFADQSRVGRVVACQSGTKIEKDWTKS